MTNPFSLLVVADTQYLFDGERQRPDLLAATFDEVATMQRTGAIAPVAHIIHVGDVTEHGWPGECSAALNALRAGVRAVGSPGMTIATGNHDVAHHSRDDRGPTSFVDVFGPGCELLEGTHLASTVQHGPGGYSSWRTIQPPGGPVIGVLALDWRPSEDGWQWAGRTLHQHRHVPTVVVSHDVAVHACLTEHGTRLDAFLEPHRQVFLVVGGHEWPSTRVQQSGREYHAINYQELPFGGAGAARIYHVDPRSGVCQAISLCPSLRQPGLLGSVAARRRLSLSREEDQFSFPLPVALGTGRDDHPWQADGLRLVADVVPDGVLEFTAPLASRSALEIQCRLPEAMSRQWQVLLARLGPSPADSPEPLAALSLSTENFLGWMAFVEAGETWATSHEYPTAADATIVVSTGDDGGMWVNGDAVGRVDPHLSSPLIAGPWRWRVGAGEYDGAFTDEYGGAIHRVRLWTCDDD